MYTLIFCSTVSGCSIKPTHYQGFVIIGPRVVALSYQEMWYCTMTASESLLKRSDLFGTPESVFILTLFLGCSWKLNGSCT